MSEIINPNARPKCLDCKYFIQIKGVTGASHPRCLMAIMPLMQVPNNPNALLIDVLECPVFESKETPLLKS